MQRYLTALAIALPAISMAGPADEENAAWKKIFKLLPPGSEMKEVMLPRYDPDKKLTSVLKAGMMTLVSEEQIEGKTIAIEFFNPDQTPKGRIDLTRALIDKTKGMLTTKEPVEIKIDGLKANGTGLFYAFEKGRGFLLGPATTIIRQPPKTAMNTRESPFRAMALVGMSLFTQSLLAAPPAAMTEAELAAIQADAASRAPAAGTRAAEAIATLGTDIKDAKAASEAAATFLVQADLSAVNPDDANEEAKPLEVPANNDNTVISCDGGIYFDPDEGVLVYLKNVTVKDPRFDLSGRIDEVKVFFGKKPADAKKAAKAADDKSRKGFGGDIGSNIGDPERIIATGVIRIKHKPKDGKEPIEASGAIFTYNVKTDEATLSGGFPWVRQGARYFSSKKSDNLLRIYPKKSSFDTPGGGWNMGFPIPDKNN